MSLDAIIEKTADVLQLQNLVQARLMGRLRDFRINVEPKGLVLQGRSVDYYTKQLVQHAVMESSDRPIVRNELIVS
jgi:hypothetical protein